MHSSDWHLNDRGRAFQIREVCADFEELRGFQRDHWREDVPDDRPGDGRVGIGGLGGAGGGRRIGL